MRDEIFASPLVDYGAPSVICHGGAVEFASSKMKGGEFPRESLNGILRSRNPRVKAERREEIVCELGSSATACSSRALTPRNAPWCYLGGGTGGGEPESLLLLTSHVTRPVARTFEAKS